MVEQAYIGFYEDQSSTAPTLIFGNSREKHLWRAIFHATDSLRSSHSNLELSYFQSNVEGELINTLHEVGFNYDGIILNAGGYTHTSVAISDAILY